MKENKNTDQAARLDKRNAILAALAKAKGEMPAADSTDEPDGGRNSYYTMSRDEVNALVQGNIEKIESWVSNLDRHHATWLLRWLIKESG
jgi:hypothetical protein